LNGASKLLWLGFALVLVGFLVTALGALSESGPSVTAGGFVLIGPFLIGFGKGPNAGMLEAVGLIITVVFVAVYIVSFLAWRSANRRGAEIPTQSE